MVQAVLNQHAPLGGDGDDCLLVDHRATTLENPISRPLKDALCKTEMRASTSHAIS
jgi:hypothetical protein